MCWYECAVCVKVDIQYSLLKMHQWVGFTTRVKTHYTPSGLSQATAFLFSYLQMFLSKHEINHNHRLKRIKQKLKRLENLSFPPPSPPPPHSGSSGTKGRSWRPGTCWSASKYSPLILWFMNRKQETIHREECILLEPGFGPHGKIETTLRVGGLPCHPQGRPTL